MLNPVTGASPVLRDRRAGLVLLVLLTLVLAVASMCVGTLDISPATTWQAITAFDPTDSQHLVVVHQRVPRALTGVAVGIAVGIAGALMQALTRNPLAEPGLLGVNAGAACAIACAIAFLGAASVVTYVWWSMLGAALAAVLVIALAGRAGANPVRLVLAGAATSVVLAAATQMVLINSTESTYDRYRHWMVGSLAGRGYEVLAVVSVAVLVGVVVAGFLTGPLDAIVLGEDLGRSLGASPGRTWALAGLAVVVLAGGATAAAGPITFLGLAAPHVARMLVGVSHRWVLPYSALVGVLLVLLADVLGRVLPDRGEIAVGTMVALLGGPFFVLLARRRKLVRL